MANDTHTILNPGTGGDAMDETSVTYGSAPTTRKRPRVVVGLDDGSLISDANPFAVNVQNLPATQPVSGTVAVSNFPAELTQAELATELDEKLGDLGQAVMASSAPVVIASDQSAIAVTGPATQAQLEAELDEKFGNLGQAAMVASAPVVLASDQSAIPVTGTFYQVTQPVSGPVTQAELTTELDEKLGDLGQALMAASAPVVIASDQSAVPVSGTFYQATQPVSVASLPLPAGAVSDANLDEKFGDLGQSNMAGSAPVVLASDQSAIPVTGTFYQATQPISAASLPLPTGAVSDANLDEKFGDLGQKNMAGSAPVVLASDQASIPVTGTFYQATQPVSGTVTANLGTTGGIVTDANLDEKFGDLGQAAMAGSAPVVIASNQTAVPVSGTVTANLGTIGAAATAAKQPALGTAGTASADVISVQGIASGTALAVSAAALPLPSGASTAAKQPALGTAGTASADVISVQGIASGTALAVSAASLPLPAGASTAAKQPALGTAGAASADVISVQGVASMTALKVDGSAVTQPVSTPKATGGTVTGVTVSTSAVAVQASNASRKSIIITNAGTTNIYLGKDNTVTSSGSTMGIKLVPNGTYVDSGEGLYTGDIYGIGDAASSSQNVSSWERT